MYAPNHMPLAFPESQPRTVPFLVAIAIQVGFFLLLANGLGVIQIAPKPQPTVLVDIPTKEQPPVTKEALPSIDTNFVVSTPETMPEPQIVISQDTIFVDEPTGITTEPQLTQGTQDISAVAARLLRKSDPVYPPQSRRLDEQGIVVVLLTVAPNGRVAQAQVQTSSGYPRLDQAALDSVRNWLFAPAKRGEQAIAYTVSAPIRFELNGG